MTPGKTIALTRWTFVGKAISLLIHWLDFLPRSKHLLISWLQLWSTVILEPKKIKSVTVSIFSPFICLEVMGPDAIGSRWYSHTVFWGLRNVELKKKKKTSNQRRERAKTIPWADSRTHLSILCISYHDNSILRNKIPFHWMPGFTLHCHWLKC